MNIGQEVLELLKSEITEVEYNRYIKYLTYDEKKSSSDLAIFYAQNALVSNWIKSKYTQKLAHLFEVKTGSRVTIQIALKNQKNSVKTKQKVEKKQSFSLLNPSHTFDNFMVGGSNQFAYAAVKSVSEKAGEVYNPLFIYGGVGLGKTHLMQAAGNVFQNQGKNVIYTTVEQFLNDFLRHVRNQTMDRFKEKYRKCDVLLIDDIQFLSNKEIIQEEFFHTFNDIHSAGRQIVLASDRLPRAIPTIEQRLRSRFEWGLITDIQPPDLETRIAILQFKAQEVGAKVPAEVMDFIAQRAQSNIRELEGALNKVVAHASLIREEITIDLAKQALQNLVNRRLSITVQMVLEVVSAYYGVTIEELKSNSRSKRIAGPRHMAMYLAREETTASLPQIGEILGNRDHTTIMYGYEKITKLVETDDTKRKEAMQLREKLYQKLA